MTSSSRLIRRGAVALVAIGALSAAAFPTFASGGDKSAAVRAAVKSGKARNVILLIGDGMGDSEITIARNYAKGAAGRLAMDTLPLTGEYTTYAVSKADPSKPDYVTDSAASGTGWSTGHKTYNGAISVTPDGKAQSTVLEPAKKAGFRTGDVTTAELGDATPAVLAAHVEDRSCEGPADMAKCPKQDKVNGGPGSISEQQVRTGADIYLGGGRARFAQTVKAGPYKGKTVIDQAKAAGYNVVTDTAGLAAAKSDRKLLGLFADSNLPLEQTGPLAKVGGTEPSRCAPNGEFSGPHLTDMAGKALQLLDAQTKHAKCQTAMLVTADGAEMKINYATTKPGVSQEHTGTEVRIAAQGPQAANVVGVTDQTDLFHTLSLALGVGR